MKKRKKDSKKKKYKTPAKILREARTKRAQRRAGFYF